MIRCQLNQIGVEMLGRYWKHIVPPISKQVYISLIATALSLLVAKMLGTKGG